MPDPTHCGNGWPCPGCTLRRIADPWQLDVPPCNCCGGSGRIPKPTEQIIEEHVAEAAIFHWKTA